MGLFSGGISQITMSDLEVAVDRIANYYRQTRLYLSLCNSSDAYDYIVKNYTQDFKVMIETQHCYKYKGNYLFATDLKEFNKDYPDVFIHFYGCIPNMLAYVKRERKPVMFINSIGPDGESMTINTYKLIREFVQKYKKDFVILTDCTAGIDQATNTFEKSTGCRKMDISSNVFYRWGGDTH